MVAWERVLNQWWLGDGNKSFGWSLPEQESGKNNVFPSIGSVGRYVFGCWQASTAVRPRRSATRPTEAVVGPASASAGGTSGAPRNDGGRHSLERWRAWCF